MSLNIHTTRSTLKALTFLCLVLLSPATAFAQRAWTIGSTYQEVVRIQGEPDDVHEYPASGKYIIDYGFSTITFDWDSGRVMEWSNSSDNLSVEYRPGRRGTRSGHFTLGSHQDDVLRLQGTPEKINRYPASGYEVWSYGFATIKIDIHNKTVVEWSDSGKTLNVSLPAGRNSSRVQYFGEGSHEDDVLRLQGTPERINKYAASGYEICDRPPAPETIAAEPCSATLRTPQQRRENRLLHC